MLKEDAARAVLLLVARWLHRDDATHIPDVFAEARGAAVQRVRAVVRAELVFFPVELERGAADAVAVTPDDLPEVRGVREIGGQVRQREHERDAFALHGQRQAAQRAAEREDLRLQAVFGTDGVELDLTAVGEPAERTRRRFQDAFRARLSKSRCKRQKSNSKAPTTILVHHELRLPSNAMRVWMMPRISTPNNVPAT